MSRQHGAMQQPISTAGARQSDKGKQLCACGAARISTQIKCQLPRMQACLASAPRARSSARCVNSAQCIADLPAACGSLACAHAATMLADAAKKYTAHLFMMQKLVLSSMVKYWCSALEPRVTRLCRSRHVASGTATVRFDSSSIVISASATGLLPPRPPYSRSSARLRSCVSVKACPALAGAHTVGSRYWTPATLSWSLTD